MVEQKLAMLHHAVQSGKVANAYLITGSLRGATMELCNKFLQLLFCTSENAPCSSCKACLQVLSKQTPDIHWISPEKKSRIISVKQMREGLLSLIYQTSFAGGWKVGVILAADCMHEAAANAFLKTLEEPPGKTLFILLSDAPQQLLPTIISRCQRIDMAEQSRLDEPWHSQILEVLSNATPGKVIESIAFSTALLDILSNLKIHAEKIVLAEVKKERADDEGENLNTDAIDARISACYLEFRREFIITLQNWHRDLFVVKSGGAAEILYEPVYLDVYAKQVENLSLADVIYNMDAITELARQFDRNLPESLALAHATGRMR